MGETRMHFFEFEVFVQEVCWFSVRIGVLENSKRNTLLRIILTSLNDLFSRLTLSYISSLL